MSFLGALATAGLLIAGVYWFLTHVTFRGDDNEKDDNK